MRPKNAPFSSSQSRSHWLSAEEFSAFEREGTNAHRLYSEADGWIERFAEDILISYKNDASLERLLAGLEEWSGSNGHAFRRCFGKFLPKQNEERIAPVLLTGEAGLPLTSTVKENGVNYAIDFEAGYSAGLFIDQRANRAFVRRSDPKRVLNTFAYTCSFSVVSALAGAETVSVDLSKKSLDRGRENFRLNELDDSKHRFIADDVLDVLPRLARRGDKFDVIILDPPTFSRGNKGRRFQVEQHMEDLLNAALELASPQARVLLSTNCTRLDRRALEQIARYALKVARLNGSFHQEAPLRDIPPSLSAQTLWLTLR